MATPENIERVRRARLSLARELRRQPSLREIGDRLGISRERVRQICASAGDPTNGRQRAISREVAKRRDARVIESAARRAERESFVARVLSLHDQGLVQTAIAKRVGVSQRYVSKLLQDAGRKAHHAGRRWTFAEHVQVMRLKFGGASHLQIAMAVGSSVRYVAVMVARLREDDEYARRVREKAGEP
jgi:AraC-like DNA-binding protein